MDSIPRTSGIYQILCVPTGKIYIGSAVNLRKRYNQHWNALHRGKHESSYLQHAWGKYGERAFVFTVIELVLESFLLEREQYWMDKFRSYDRDYGFNYRPAAESTRGYRARASDETRAKMSEFQRNRPRKSPIQEVRDRIAAALRGRKLPPEHGQKVSLALRGKPKPEGFGAKQAERQWGIPPSENARIARCKSWIVTDPDGNEYEVFGLRDFCIRHGLEDSNKRKVANGDISQSKGWKCRRA